MPVTVSLAVANVYGRRVLSSVPALTRLLAMAESQRLQPACGIVVIQAARCGRYPCASAEVVFPHLDHPDVRAFLVGKHSHPAFCDAEEVGTQLTDAVV